VHAINNGASRWRTLHTHFLRWVAVWGPGVLVMLADTDAGNVVTAAQAGARWGYRLLPLLLLLVPLLYMVQELTVRLGIFTGRGHGELIREKFGRGWSYLAVLGLFVAVAGSLVTEFTGVAGIAELYGIARGTGVSVAALVLMAVVFTGSYRSVERVALFIGFFELAFFYVAWKAHPDLGTVAHQVVDIPAGNPEFLFLAAALVGAVFNPWMVFYQQSAVADKGLTPEDLPAARWDTAFGALLTQLLTAAVLVAAAATLGPAGAAGSGVNLDSVGAISGALTPLLGLHAGRLIFSMGVLGASMVAAIVSSLALAWGMGEVAGFRRSLEASPLQAPTFYAFYVLMVLGSAALVLLVPDLVWLSVAAQVVNAFMLPLVIGFLLALSTRLPAAQRLRGPYLWVMVGLSVATCLIGFVGGLSGLL